MQGYKPPDEGPQEYQSIPLSKIEDFGVHCKQYYPLDVSYFKSTRDNQLLSLLWNRYWVNTLSSNALFAVRSLCHSLSLSLSALMLMVIMNDHRTVSTWPTKSMTFQRSLSVQKLSSQSEAKCREALCLQPRKRRKNPS